MILLIILGLVWLAYKWSIDNHDYFEKLGINFEKPKPLAGNMLDIALQRQSMIEVTRAGYKNFKKSK
jgi:hypothetical protein